MKVLAIQISTNGSFIATVERENRIGKDFKMWFYGNNPLNGNWKSSKQTTKQTVTVKYCDFLFPTLNFVHIFAQCLAYQNC